MKKYTKHHHSILDRESAEDITNSASCETWTLKGCCQQSRMTLMNHKKVEVRTPAEEITVTDEEVEASAISEVEITTGKNMDSSHACSERVRDER